MSSSLKNSLLVIHKKKEKAVSIYPIPDGNVKYDHSKTETGSPTVRWLRMQEKRNPIWQSLYLEMIIKKT